ncbi:hypothetical protein ACWDR9_22865, partial [Streptosporangium sandarakinum]
TGGRSRSWCSSIHFWRLKGGIMVRSFAVLGTWDLVTRPPRDRAGALAWLAGRSDVPRDALAYLASVRDTLLRPGGAPWPTPAEVERVLAVARDLRSAWPP